MGHLTNKEIHQQQVNEITEHILYERLARASKDKHNKEILKEISQDELKHYNMWKKITKKDVKPDMKKVYMYYFFAKIFGLAFSLKLMEGGESSAKEFYSRAEKDFSELKGIEEDEHEHERKLVNILNDEKLEYAGAIVLGLNDALVELTGTLAGLTLAIQDNTIIATTGLIMGIAAAMSMAASGYLSSKENPEESNPVKSAIYTGVAYIITVFILVSPYFLLENVNHSLLLMLGLTIVIIASYTSYISVAKELSFKRKFLEMAIISLGVAAISYGIGYIARIMFGIHV